MNPAENTVAQGAKANFSGQKLENEVEAILQSLDLEYQKEYKFTDCYGNTKSRMDFMVGGLAIECKRQMVGGTVDQKMPFVFENLSLFDRGLLVIDGDHFRKREGIINYLNNKAAMFPFFSWVWFEDLEDWLLEQTEFGQTPK